MSRQPRSKPTPPINPDPDPDPNPDLNLSGDSRLAGAAAGSAACFDGVQKNNWPTERQPRPISPLRCTIAGVVLWWFYGLPSLRIDSLAAKMVPTLTIVRSFLTSLEFESAAVSFPERSAPSGIYPLTDIPHVIVIAPLYVRTHY